MDVVHSKSDLVGSPRPTNIFGKLKGGRVGVTRSRRPSEESKRPRHGGERDLRVTGRVVKTVYPHVAPREKVFRKTLLVERAKQRSMERANHVGSDQVGIAQNE